MRILCIINEDKLFKKTIPVRKLFFSSEDYRKLNEMAEVIHIQEEEITNIREPPVLEKIEKILPSIDFVYEDLCYIPEDIISKYENIKAIAQARGKFPPYSEEYYKKAMARGMHFLSESSAYAPAVAEMALGHVINLLRNISGYHSQMQNGEEQFGYNSKNSGDSSLHGKTVGIIGFGRVASAFVNLLGPFNVKIYAYDPFVNAESMSCLGVVKISDLKELFSQVDILVVMAMPHETNKRMINREAFTFLKDGCIFVNVARAEIIDIEALVEWLKAGRGKAAIDVFDKEPLEPDSELRKLPNLVLTPHRAGGILYSYRLIGHYMLMDFEAIFKGEIPVNMKRLTPENFAVFFRE